MRISFSLIPGRVRDIDPPTPDGKEDYDPYSALMTIFRPTRMDTLTSLLERPVQWIDIDGTHKKTHVITGIDMVDVEELGALLAPADGKEDFTFRNVVKTCGFRTMDMRQESKDETIKQLAKFVPVLAKDHTADRRGDWQPYPAITIYTGGHEDMAAWLANVSDRILHILYLADPLILQLTTFLLRQPRMFVEFSANGNLTHAEFQDRVLRAASAYGSIWHQLKDSLKRLTNGSARQEFCVMDYEHGYNDDMFRGTYGDPNGAFTLAGEFKCARTGDGFSVKILEVDEATGEDRTTYDRPFNVPPA